MSLKDTSAQDAHGSTLEQILGVPIPQTSSEGLPATGGQVTTTLKSTFFILRSQLQLFNMKNSFREEKKKSSGPQERRGHTQDYMRMGILVLC